MAQIVAVTLRGRRTASGRPVGSILFMRHRSNVGRVRSGCLVHAKGRTGLSSPHFAAMR